MKFALDKKDSYTVFSLLEPKLNTLFAPDLKTELTILHNEGIGNIILDLEKVAFVDSSGLS
ncbi:MAG: STAS domain-containing protein, partial [Chitinophagales bacterium]